MAITEWTSGWELFKDILTENSNLPYDMAVKIARGNYEAFRQSAVSDYIKGGFAARSWASDEALIAPGQSASYAFDLWRSQYGLTPINTASGNAATQLTRASPVAIAKPPSLPPSAPYSALGFLSADVGVIGAAAAPILGVALGAGLYELNPELWTKISQTLLPWAYKDTENIAVLADKDGQTFLPKALVQALKDLFEEEGILNEDGQIISESTARNPAYSDVPQPVPFYMATSGTINPHGTDSQLRWSSETPLTTINVETSTGYGGWWLINLTSASITVRYGYRLDRTFTVNPRSGYSYIPGNPGYTGLTPNYFPGNTSLGRVVQMLMDSGTVITEAAELPPGTSKWGGTSVSLDSLPVMPVVSDFGNGSTPDTLEDWVPVALPQDGSGASLDPTVNPDPSQSTDPKSQVEPYMPTDGMPFELPDGTVYLPDGTIVFPKQKVGQLPNGRIVTDILISPDGQSGTWPDGTPLPSGTQITELIVQPDGTVTTEDGSITDFIPVNPGSPLPKPVPDWNPDPDTDYNPDEDPDNRPDQRPQPSDDIPDKTPDRPGSEGDTDLGPDPMVPLPWGQAGGLIAVYHPSQSILESFARWLWVTWQDATIDKIWNNPFDGVISLHEVYCTPPDNGNRTIKSGFLDSQISCPTVDRYTSIDCGSIVVPEYWGNYLDYSPYSRAFIYLPFIGIVEVDVDDIVGHAVHIEYRIDVYNGSCIAVVTVAKSGYNTIMYQYSGNCGVELPLSGGTQAAIKAGMIQAAAYGISSVVSGALNAGASAAQGNLAGAIANLGSGVAFGAANAAGSMVSAKSSVQHSGSFGSSFGAMGNKKPFIIVRRPVQVQVTNYNLQYGYPAHKLVLLNTCHGYLRCREAHVISSTASDEEKSTIEAMLKNGVYVDE